MRAATAGHDRDVTATTAATSLLLLLLLLLLLRQPTQRHLLWSYERFTKRE